MTVTAQPDSTAEPDGPAEPPRTPRDSSAGPSSMERLSTPEGKRPPPPSASAPLPRLGPASPHIRPIGTPLPAPKRSRRRMPDEVRNSVVRSIVLLASTLTAGMVVALALAGGSWFAMPMTVVALVLAVTTLCSWLEIMVARQVHNEHVARGERCPFDP